MTILPALTAMLLSASAASAANRGVDESCFLALHFAEGNVASVQLSNAEGKPRGITIERYSSDGRLLDNIAKSVPANGKTEVRIDLSSAVPEFGWMRVLTQGKAVTIETTLEMTQGGTLQSLPEQAVYRDPRPNKRLSPMPHRWKFDLINNLGALAYFVNLSEYPVHVAMCQDEVPDCTSPILPYTVGPMASISFPLDHSRRYAVIESTPGYSTATSLRFTEGDKKHFDVASCIEIRGEHFLCSDAVGATKSCCAEVRVAAPAEGHRQLTGRKRFTGRSVA